VPVKTRMRWPTTNLTPALQLACQWEPALFPREEMLIGRFSSSQLDPQRGDVACPGPQVSV
jgi:hypothetical protein